MQCLIKNPKSKIQNGGRRRLRLLMLASVLGLWPLRASAAGGAPVRTEADSPSGWAALYARLPLSFEVNQGQSDPTVEYLAHGPGYTLWLTTDQAVLALRSGETGNWPVVRMKLVRANQQATISGLNELPGKSNYFIGNDPEKWRTDIPNYAQVKYANIYPGVDLVYYGSEGQLEYDFVVAPGGDPRAIALQLASGESKIQNPKSKIEANGDLVVAMGDGELRFHKPMVYQPLNARAGLVPAQGHPQGVPLRTVDGKYVLQGNRITFEIASYDNTKPLVIDPVLSYSTYLGGSGGDVAFGIAVDGSGNAYATGQTYSTNFPTASAEQSSNAGNGDAFVTKINSTGSALIYSTYLGGAGSDIGNSIALSAGGDAFITGGTTSSNFPIAPTVTPPSTSPVAFQPTYGGDGDAFVTQLNSTGNKLVYSSYLGGKGADVGQAVAVDSTGNAYVTGQTCSTNFAVLNPLPQDPVHGTNVGTGCDAFVAKVNFGGTALVYSTYLGGSDADVGQGIQVDSSGSAYVAGYTFSTNFPTENPYQASNAGAPDAFVAELNAAGSALVFSTYLGGKSDDRAYGIALDTSGGIYVTGQSQSTDFPTTVGSFQTGNGGGGDAFVTKFNANGAGLGYSTFLGASGADRGNGIAVCVAGMSNCKAGEAFVTGFTQSGVFPTADPVQSSIGLGRGSSCGSTLCSDAFVARLNASGSALVYSTYLGGSAADYGQAIALDSTGDPYVTGNTLSSDFPVAAGISCSTFCPAYQGELAGAAGNAFIAKIDVANSPGIAIVPAKLNFGNQTLSVRSAPQTVTVINAGTAALSVSAITSSSADFVETDDCLGTVNAGGSTCTMNVTYTPSTLGAETATITITDNAANSPQSISLTGTGVTAGTQVTLSPTSLSFSNQVVGSVSAPQTVTITNTGTSTLTITGISASSNFLETDTCHALLNVLNPGQSCTVSVSFSPTATGGLSGTLSVSDNATGSPQSVALSGTGTAQFALSSPTPSSSIVVGTTTATFTVSAAGSNFSGTITLTCSSGATCSFSPASIFAGQTSTLTVSSLSAATLNPFNFTVNGTSGSQTATLTLTILLSDYSLSVTPLLATITQGQQAPYTLIVTPLNGFNQQVNFACTTTTLPTGSTCAFSSTSATPNGSSPVSVRFSINTTLTSSPPRPWSGPMRKLPLYVIIGLLGLGALRCWPPGRRQSPSPTATGRRRWLPVPELAAALVLALLLGGCRSAATAVTGTPPGNYTVTITGTLNSNTAVVRSTIVNLAVTCAPSVCPSS